MFDAGQASTSSSSETALLFLSKGANSFKNLANSFDREIEYFLSSTPTFCVQAAIRSPASEIDFMKKLQPNLSEFRRTYSSPDFSSKVLEKWSPAMSIRLNLSAIRNAIVSEADGEESLILGRFRREKKLNFREFWGEWKSAEEEEGQSKDSCRFVL